MVTEETLSGTATTAKKGQESEVEALKIAYRKLHVRPEAVRRLQEIEELMEGEYAESFQEVFKSVGGPSAAVKATRVAAELVARHPQLKRKERAIALYVYSLLRERAEQARVGQLGTRLGLTEPGEV